MAKAKIAPREERNDMLADLQAISHIASIAQDLVNDAVLGWSGDRVGTLELTRRAIEQLEFAVDDTADKAAAAYERWRDAPLPVIAEPAPRMPLHRQVEDPISGHIDRLESHDDIHELFELFVDIEKLVALHAFHPRNSNDGPAADALQELASFINWQIDTLHEKARNTPPISRMSGEKRALTMIAYELSNRRFAAEIIDAAQGALAELESMGFAADDQIQEDSAP